MRGWMLVNVFVENETMLLFWWSLVKVTLFCTMARSYLLWEHPFAFYLLTIVFDEAISRIMFSYVYYLTIVVIIIIIIDCLKTVGNQAL